MDPETLVKQLLSDTQTLLETAQAGDWDRFNNLYPARAARVKELENLELESQAQAEELRETLIQIRQLNEELVKLADGRAAELVAEKRALNRGRKMKNAYKSV